MLSTAKHLPPRSTNHEILRSAQNDKRALSMTSAANDNRGANDNRDE